MSPSGMLHSTWLRVPYLKSVGFKRIPLPYN